MSLKPSVVESLVPPFLASIKSLLESLNDWSHQRVDEQRVRDGYVGFGNHFDALIAAFALFDISMS